MVFWPAITGENVFESTILCHNPMAYKFQRMCASLAWQNTRRTLTTKQLEHDACLYKLMSCVLAAAAPHTHYGQIVSFILLGRHNWIRRAEHIDTIYANNIQGKYACGVLIDVLYQ